MPLSLVDADRVLAWSATRFVLGRQVDADDFVTLAADLLAILLQILSRMEPQEARSLACSEIFATY